MKIFVILFCLSLTGCLEFNERHNPDGNIYLSGYQFRKEGVYFLKLGETSGERAYFREKDKNIDFFQKKEEEHNDFWGGVYGFVFGLDF